MSNSTPHRSIPCMYSSETSTSSISSTAPEYPSLAHHLDLMVPNASLHAHQFSPMDVNGAGSSIPQRHLPNYSEAVYQNRQFSGQNQHDMAGQFHFNAASINQFRPQYTNGCGKRKRIRTAFTTCQLSELENHYKKNRYLERTTRMFLSRTLNVSERIIKIWFQNRRMKEKKERNECQSADECTSSQPAVGSDDQYYLPMHQCQVVPEGLHQNGGGSLEMDQMHNVAAFGVLPMMDNGEHVYMEPVPHQLNQQPCEPHSNGTAPAAVKSEVISPAFGQFVQYCDMQSDYYSE